MEQTFDYVMPPVADKAMGAELDVMRIGIGGGDTGGILISPG